MSTITQKKLTAEDFFQLPDPGGGQRQELIHGEVVTMPPPGMLHGVTVAKVSRRLGNFIDAGLGGTLATESGIITTRASDSVRGPDVAYWSKERLKEISIGYSDLAPDMLVEVLSPSNTWKQSRKKLQEYFDLGVRFVWVIAPEDRTLTIYRNADEGRVLHENATVTGEEVLPGFECRASDLLP